MQVQKQIKNEKKYKAKYDDLYDLYDIGYQLKNNFINYEEACDLVKKSWPYTTFKGKEIKKEVFGENDDNVDTIIFYNYKNNLYEIDEADSYNYYAKNKNTYIHVFSN